MRHENFAGNADDIADVVFFEFRIRLIAQNVALKVKLNLTVAVKDMRETCLAHDAFADESSGKRHGFALVFFKIIDESTIDTKTVSVGCIVKLQDLEFGDKLEYKIVGVSEAKIEENLISNESPLGSALIGKKKGQEVVVTTPGGEARFKILSINA